MIQVEHSLYERGLEATMLAQIHDELLLEASDSEVPKVAGTMLGNNQVLMIGLCLVCRQNQLFCSRQVLSSIVIYSNYAG